MSHYSSLLFLMQPRFILSTVPVNPLPPPTSILTPPPSLRLSLTYKTMISKFLNVQSVMFETFLYQKTKDPSDAAKPNKQN